MLQWIVATHLSALRPATNSNTPEHLSLRTVLPHRIDRRLRRMLSANAFRAYASDHQDTFTLISSLGLESAVEVVSGTDAQGVAEAMRRCAFVTVSSTRRETFCSVAAESMACRTPLVMTRCDGPEEFVTKADGVLVSPDDPAVVRPNGRACPTR